MKENLKNVDGSIPQPIPPTYTLLCQQEKATNHDIDNRCDAASEFYGAAAEVAVFDRALTAQEVSNAFNFDTADE